MAQQGKVVAPKDAKPVAGKIAAASGIAVEILSVDDENPIHPPEDSEHWEIAVEYPDGFVKSHQVPKTAPASVLAAMIANQIKGRHGVEVKLASAMPSKGFDKLVGERLQFKGA